MIVWQLLLFYLWTWFFVGCQTKKIICSQVFSGKCKICSAAEAKDELPGPHECCRNHKGSSKLMEADSALKLLLDLHQKMTPRYISNLLSQMTITRCKLYFVSRHQQPKRESHNMKRYEMKAKTYMIKLIWLLKWNNPPSLPSSHTNTEVKRRIQNSTIKCVGRTNPFSNWNAVRSLSTPTIIKGTRPWISQ